MEPSERLRFSVYAPHCTLTHTCTACNLFPICRALEVVVWAQAAAAGAAAGPGAGAATPPAAPGSASPRACARWRAACRTCRGLETTMHATRSARSVTGGERGGRVPWQVFGKLGFQQRRWEAAGKQGSLHLLATATNQLMLLLQHTHWAATGAPQGAVHHKGRRATTLLSTVRPLSRARRIRRGQEVRRTELASIFPMHLLLHQQLAASS